MAGESVVEGAEVTILYSLDYWFEFCEGIFLEDCTKKKTKEVCVYVCFRFIRE